MSPKGKLARRIQRLPRNEQTLLALVAGEGLEVGAAAKILGICRDEAQKRLQKALALLESLDQQRHKAQGD